MKITGASASSYEGLCFSIIPPPSWGLFPWGFSPVYSQSASSLHVRSSSLLACSLISVTIWAGIRRSRLALGKRPSFENPFRDATEVVHCFIGCWDAFVHQPIGCWDAFGHQPLATTAHSYVVLRVHELRLQCGTFAIQNHCVLNDFVAAKFMQRLLRSRRCESAFRRSLLHGARHVS